MKTMTTKKYWPRHIVVVPEDIKKEIVLWYKFHSLESTRKKFSYGFTIIKKILKENDIPLHSQTDAQFFTYCENNGIDASNENLFISILSYYDNGHSFRMTAEHFKITQGFLMTLFKRHNKKITRTMKEEAELTSMEKHGVPHFTNPDKIKETNLKKYGVEYPLQNKEIFSKTAITLKDRFGVDSPYRSPEIRKKMQESYKNNHGTNTPFESISWQHDSTLKSKETKKLLGVQKYNSPLANELRLNKDEMVSFINSQEDKTIFGLSQKLNIPYHYMQTWLENEKLLNIVDLYPKTSHYEKDIADFIGEDLCIMNNRHLISPYEIDIYVPSKNLGIEFNGNIWHSTLFKKDNKYHFNKAKQAESKGIRLIQIWQYEWDNPKQQEKIKMMLNIALGRVKTKLYARQCEIRQITNQEAKILNEKVHLQGHRNAQITYGLFYQNKLIQLMSFSKTRYNKNLKGKNDWEIIRGCPASNNIVVGGVEKLFKHFIEDYKPDHVFSYCDFNKFNGKSYEEIGMKFIGYTGPNMKWLMPSGKVINRNPSKHKELKEAAEAQIWEAGSKKYLWTNPNLKA